MGNSRSTTSRIARRLAFGCVGAIVATAVAASPAQADAQAQDATNPWTAAEACNAANGGGKWNEVQRDDLVYDPENMKVGDLYLMHGDGFEKWCAVLVKRADIGKNTLIHVQLDVYDKAGDHRDSSTDTGELPHYIAVIADDWDGCKDAAAWMRFRDAFAVPGSIERGC
jgi:hypothetical protein